MSSPCYGTSDLLQSPSKECFDNHPKMKVSHKSEMRVRLWTLSSDAHSQGSQDALPVRDRASGPFYDVVGPGPHEWVELCYCLSKWRFD